MRPPTVPAVTAPDLRLLPPRAAEHRLAEYGLRARFEGQGLRVLSQVPPAGQPIERGDVVLAYLAAPQDSIGRSLPDLVGLPVREAVRHHEVELVVKRDIDDRIHIRALTVQMHRNDGSCARRDRAF